MCVEVDLCGLEQKGSGKVRRVVLSNEMLDTSWATSRLWKGLRTGTCCVLEHYGLRWVSRKGDPRGSAGRVSDAGALVCWEKSFPVLQALGLLLKIGFLLRDVDQRTRNDES